MHCSIATYCNIAGLKNGPELGKQKAQLCSALEPMCCPPTNHVAQIDDKGILDLNLQSHRRTCNEGRLRISLGSNVPKLRLWHLVPAQLSQEQFAQVKRSAVMVSFSCNLFWQPTHSWLSLILQAYWMINAFMFAQTFLNLKVCFLKTWCTVSKFLAQLYPQDCNQNQKARHALLKDKLWQLWLCCSKLIVSHKQNGCPECLQAIFF